MEGRLSWRTGFDINLEVASWLPVVSLVAGVVAIFSGLGEDTDIRLSLFPWFMAIAILGLVGCCLGVLRVHRGDSRLVTFGGWWTVLALLGLFGFVAALAVGAVIGITDEVAGWLAWPPMLGAAFGAATIAPAIAVLAWGTLRASVLPIYGSAAAFAAAPMVPLGAFLGGNVFEQGFFVALVVFAAAWIVIGFSLRGTDR
jgi:F0F1-type ATP synthase assembly protein I